MIALQPDFSMALYITLASFSSGGGHGRADETGGSEQGDNGDLHVARQLNEGVLVECIVDVDL